MEKTAVSFENLGSYDSTNEVKNYKLRKVAAQNSTLIESCYALLNKDNQCYTDTTYVGATEYRDILVPIIEKMNSFIEAIASTTEKTPEAYKLHRWCINEPPTPIIVDNYSDRLLTEVAPVTLAIKIAKQLNRLLRNRVRAEIKYGDGEAKQMHKHDFSNIDSSNLQIVTLLDEKKNRRKDISREDITKYKEILKAAIDLYHVLQDNIQGLKEAQSSINTQLRKLRRSQN